MVPSIYYTWYFITLLGQHRRGCQFLGARNLIYKKTSLGQGLSANSLTYQKRAAPSITVTSCTVVCDVSHSLLTAVYTSEGSWKYDLLPVQPHCVVIILTKWPTVGHKPFLRCRHRFTYNMIKHSNA